jgi:hypothetical protein
VTVRIACTFVLLLLVGPTWASHFCNNASLVPMDQIAADKDMYLNKRVRSHAVLRTDAKEFSLLKQDETTHFGLRTITDDESVSYSNGLSPQKKQSFNTKGDFFEKLREMEGRAYRPDMTKIIYYRQDVLVCGRLVKSDKEYYFAIDDMVIEKTYLLPWDRLKLK